MDRAFLHASISTSTQVADLSILGQLIFERMFPHADFQGRLTGHPRKIKATVIPMVDASAEEVSEQLQKMHDVGLTIWYEAGGEKIVQLVSWWKFQDRRFAHPSKFPPPDGWKDRLRYNDPHNPKTLILENWEGTFGKPRTRKIRLDASNRSHDDAYIGNLHRPLTKEAQNDPSASASEKKDLSSESSDSDSPPSPTGAKEEPGNGKEPTPREVRSFFDSWNAEALHLPKARELNESRKRKIRIRLRERPLDEWCLVFRRMNSSSFLRGESGSGTFHANLDWITKNEGNAVKVLEGQYDDRGSRRSAPDEYVGTAGRKLERLT